MIVTPPRPASTRALLPILVMFLAFTGVMLGGMLDVLEVAGAWWIGLAAAALIGGLLALNAARARRNPARIRIDDEGVAQLKSDGSDRWGVSWSAVERVDLVESNGAMMCRFLARGTAGRVRQTGLPSEAVAEVTRWARIHGVEVADASKLRPDYVTESRGNGKTQLVFFALAALMILLGLVAIAISVGRARPVTSTAWMQLVLGAHFVTLGFLQPRRHRVEVGEDGLRISGLDPHGRVMRQRFYLWSSLRVLNVERHYRRLWLAPIPRAGASDEPVRVEPDAVPTLKTLAAAHGVPTKAPSAAPDQVV